MANPNFNQQDIDAFMKTLTKWGSTLSKKEQDLLRFVTNQAEHTGALTDDALDKVVGGRAALSRPKVGGGGDFWAQWSARQY